MMLLINNNEFKEIMDNRVKQQVISVGVKKWN